VIFSLTKEIPDVHCYSKKEVIYLKEDLYAKKNHTYNQLNIIIFFSSPSISHIFNLTKRVPGLHFLIAKEEVIHLKSKLYEKLIIVKTHYKHGKHKALSMCFSSVLFFFLRRIISALSRSYITHWLMVLCSGILTVFCCSTRKFSDQLAEQLYRL
jgi:hypothetical protein